MLAIPSLFAALTIAGAFWVGVLAARRLRDLNENDRALASGDLPLALPPSRHGPARDAATQRIRERVAMRLQSGLHAPVAQAARDASSLELEGLRVGDVVSIEGGNMALGVMDDGDASVDGDYMIEGVLRMREGASTRMVLVLADGASARWLIGGEGDLDWWIVEPVQGHDLHGEPPRNLRLEGQSYDLRRRGQAAVAAVGQHGRPAARRVSTYIYEGSQARIAWLERWDQELFAGVGHAVPARAVQFLPGA